MEVLLLSDRIDEWLMTSIFEYKGKQLKNVAKETLSKETETPKINENDKDIIEKIKTQLSDRVSDVLISD